MDFRWPAVWSINSHCLFAHIKPDGPSESLNPRDPLNNLLKVWTFKLFWQKKITMIKTSVKYLSFDSSTIPVAMIARVGEKRPRLAGSGRTSKRRSFELHAE